MSGLGINKEMDRLFNQSNNKEKGSVDLPSHGESSEDVQRLSGLVICVQHSVRVVGSSLGSELLSVDDVSSVGWQRDAVLDLCFMV